METALQTVTRTELVPYDNIIGEIVEKFITAQDVKPSSRALYRRTLNHRVQGRPPGEGYEFPDSGKLYHGGQEVL